MYGCTTLTRQLYDCCTTLYDTLDPLNTAQHSTRHRPPAYWPHLNSPSTPAAASRQALQTLLDSSFITSKLSVATASSPCPSS